MEAGRLSGAIGEACNAADFNGRRTRPQGLAQASGDSIVGSRVLTPCWLPWSWGEAAWNLSGSRLVAGLLLPQHDMRKARRLTRSGALIMTWTPFSRREIENLLAKELFECSEADCALFARVHVPLTKWSLSPWGDEGGGFWVVARSADRVLWYNDIEEGFNVLPLYRRGHHSALGVLVQSGQLAAGPLAALCRIRIAASCPQPGETASIGAELPASAGRLRCRLSAVGRASVRRLPRGWQSWCTMLRRAPRVR